MTLFLYISANIFVFHDTIFILSSSFITDLAGIQSLNFPIDQSNILN